MCQEPVQTPGSRRASGTGHPHDVHPTGTSWIENAYGHLVVRRFDDRTGDHEVFSEANCYLWAYFLSPKSVLAIREHRLPGEWPARAEEVLLEAETLEPVARIVYPEPFESEQHLAVSRAGDGTWVTITRATDDEAARLRHWRPAP